MRSRGEQPARFAMYIDEDRNELLIDATPAETRGVLKFVSCSISFPRESSPPSRPSQR